MSELSEPHSVACPEISLVPNLLLFVVASASLNSRELRGARPLSLEQPGDTLLGPSPDSQHIILAVF